MRCRSIVENWGSTVEERASSFPCDALIPSPDGVLFRAVDIAAPAPLVFRWLCQLRVAPYSYDCIDNFGRRSPRSLTRGLEHLEVGERFMRLFRLAAVEDDRSITLDSTSWLFGRVAITYAATPVDSNASRLVVKVVLESGRHPVARMLRPMLPAGDLLMMRKQLLTLKALSERDARTAKSRD